MEGVWAGGIPRSLAVRGGGDKVRTVATLEELEDIMQNSGGAIVCIDFTATWCSPCQQIAPAVEQLAQELTDVVFLKVDVDENEETANKYDVSQMPTFLFIRNGEVVDQFAGANAAVLRQKLEDMLKNNAPGNDAADERARKDEETCVDGTVGEVDAGADVGNSGETEQSYQDHPEQEMDRQEPRDTDDENPSHPGK